MSSDPFGEYDEMQVLRVALVIGGILLMLGLLAYLSTLIPGYPGYHPTVWTACC